MLVGAESQSLRHLHSILTFPWNAGQLDCQPHAMQGEHDAWSWRVSLTMSWVGMKFRYPKSIYINPSKSIYLNPFKSKLTYFDKAIWTNLNILIWEPWRLWTTTTLRTSMQTMRARIASCHLNSVPDSPTIGGLCLWPKTIQNGNTSVGRGHLWIRES